MSKHPRLVLMLLLSGKTMAAAAFVAVSSSHCHM
jgi:hypothetical protein